MEIEILQLGHIKTNCYLILCEKTAIVIDPGFKSDKTVDFLVKNSEKEKYILITHAHFDHIGGAGELKRITGAKIVMGRGESEKMNDPYMNLSSVFHAEIENFSPDILLDDGDIIKAGDIEIKAMMTPGHTAGGMSYIIGDKLFSGDTLFFESVGRTDFAGGDFSDLENSVKKLYTLDDSTEIYPGHGPLSTIGHEKNFNPYVRE